MQNAIELILWLMVPSLVLINANSLPLIELFFRHMNYSEVATVNTAHALYAYSFWHSRLRSYQSPNFLLLRRGTHRLRNDGDHFLHRDYSLR